MVRSLITIDDSFHASNAVQGLWKDLSSKNIQGKSSSVVMKIIVSDATEYLGLEGKELSEEKILCKLRDILIMASDLPDARPAILGITTILRDVGVLGGVQEEQPELMKVARDVGAAVLGTLTEGRFGRILLELQHSLSEKFIEAGLLPPKYRQAIARIRAEAERVRVKGSDIKTEDMATIGSAVHSLNILLKEISPKEISDSLIKKGPFLQRICSHFLDIMNGIIPHFQESLEVATKADEIWEQVDQLQPGQQEEAKKLAEKLRPLCHLASGFVEKGLLPTSLLNRLRIDLACCIAQQHYGIPGSRGIDASHETSEIRTLIGLIGNQIPARTRRTMFSENADAAQLLVSLDGVRKTIHKNAQVFPQYDDAMELLKRLFEGERKKEELSGEEKTLLKDFMEYALANRGLNDFLCGKGELSQIEGYLCSFTYITLQTTQTNAMGKVERKLEELGVKDFLRTCKGEGDPNQEGYVLSLDDYINEFEKGYSRAVLYEFVKGLQKVASGKEEKEAFGRNFNILFPLDKSKAPDAQVKSARRFSPQHKEAVEWFVDLAQRKGVREKAKTAIEAYHTLLRKAVEQRESLIRAADSATAVVKLSDLRDVDQFADMDRLFGVIPDDALTGIAENFKTSSKKAFDLSQDLDYALHVLPGYEPGDVVFDHERKMKEFKQKGDKLTIYSEMGRLALPQVVRDAATRGIFCVQPYFTGPLTHAALVLSLPDNDGTDLLSRAEISESYEAAPLNMMDCVVDVARRPNFTAMLTDEARKAMGKEAHSIAAQQYAECLTKFIYENREVLERIQNDPGKAAHAFIDELPSPFKEIATKIVADILAPSEQEPLQSLGELFSTKMFCSEFVGVITAVALKKLNEKLKEEFHLKGDALKETAIIDPREFSTLHPDKLEQRTRDFYTEAPRPVIAKLLLGR